MNQQEFFTSPKVVAQLDIEKTNSFGSTAHRNAHAEILKIAEQQGVAMHFESMADYDAAVVRVAALVLA